MTSSCAQIGLSSNSLVEALQNKYHNSVGQVEVIDFQNACKRIRLAEKNREGTASASQQLDQYGNLTVTAPGAWLFEWSGATHSRGPINVDMVNMIRRLTDPHVLIVRGDVDYTLIVERAFDQLEASWNKKVITDLCTSIHSMPTNFNGIRDAVYKTRPDLKGHLKSKEVLDAMHLDQIFTVDDFRQYPDEVVSYIFRHAVMLEELVVKHFVYEHPDTGDLYLRPQLSQEEPGVSLDIVVIDADRGTLRLLWVAQYMRQSPADKCIQLMPKARDNKQGTATLKMDMNTLGLSGKECTDLPVELSESQFVEFFKAIPEEPCKILATGIVPELHLLHEEQLPAVFVIPPVSLNGMTVDYLKDILRDYGAPTTGKKETLLERLSKVTVRQYSKSYEIMKQTLGPLRGIVLKRRIDEIKNPRSMIKLIPEPMKGEHKDIMLSLLCRLFIEMHVRNDTIFDVEGSDSLFSIEGLAETLVEFGERGALTLIPELKDLVDLDEVDYSGVVDQETCEHVWGKHEMAKARLPGSKGWTKHACYCKKCGVRYESASHRDSQHQPNYGEVPF